MSRSYRKLAPSGKFRVPVIDDLLDGPVDVVGDIHGEIDALNDLLQHLGYKEDGSHPENRRLVFVGDLVDRGPDSPAVLNRVKDLVEAGAAQCVLGNHELSLLRADSKPDNAWWYAPDPDSKYPQEPMPENLKEEMLAFLATLPLGLERDDLRVAHACWHEDSFEKLLSEGVEADNWGLEHNRWRDQIKKSLDLEISEQSRESELCGADITVEKPDPGYLPLKAEYDERKQMGNPVAVITSGVEKRQHRKSFYVGGKWRMVDRISWWDDETLCGNKAVVFGHYWRLSKEAREQIAKDKDVPDVFGEKPLQKALGKNKSMCIDYGVAGRPMLRKQERDASVCRLAAYRFDRGELMFDNGDVDPVDVG
jgi:hypothetical protein